MRELIEAYNAAVSILYPKYSWYIYPGYLQYAIYQNYMKYYKDKYRLVPIPNTLYEHLIKNELIKSEHIIFAAEDIYDEYAESKEVNFVNLIVSCGKQMHSPQGVTTNGEERKESGALIKQILNQAPHTLVAQIRPLKVCQPNCVFVQVIRRLFLGMGKVHFKYGTELILGKFIFKFNGPLSCDQR